jgi:hypothetical protein
MLESKRLTYCLLNFIRRNHEEFPAVFDLMTIFSSNTGSVKGTLSFNCCHLAGPTLFYLMLQR